MAHDASENFRSLNAHPARVALCQGQPEPLESRGTANQYQTGSSTCLRATPSKILRVATHKKQFSRHGEEDDDEPSLQSPAPQMVKQMERQTIREESDVGSADEFARAAVGLQATPPLSPAEPQPEALSVTKSERADPMPTLHSPVPPRRTPGQENDHNSRLAHLTESPSLPTRTAARNDQDKRATDADSAERETGIFNE